MPDERVHAAPHFIPLAEALTTAGVREADYRKAVSAGDAPSIVEIGGRDYLDFADFRDWLSKLHARTWIRRVVPAGSVLARALEAAQ